MSLSRGRLNYFPRYFVESTPVLSFNIHNIGLGGQEFGIWTGLISEYIRRPNSTPGRRIFGAYWIFRRRVGAYSAPIEFLGDGSAHIRRRAVQISASCRRPTGRQNHAVVGPNGGADSVQFRQVLLLGLITVMTGILFNFCWLGIW